LKNKLADRIPSDFFCPITEEIFFDPVMTEDGNTYERSAIELWLQGNDTSPLTNAKLKSKNLISNMSLKKLIREFYEANKWWKPKMNGYSNK